MRFDVIRRLISAERVLDRELLRASRDLAGARHKDEHLVKAIETARRSKHPMWDTFLRYARPIVEARQHIEQERKREEHAVEDAIGEATKGLRRRA